jgi:hypothetical protein
MGVPDRYRGGNPRHKVKRRRGSSLVMLHAMGQMMSAVIGPLVQMQQETMGMMAAVVQQLHLSNERNNRMLQQILENQQKQLGYHGPGLFQTLFYGIRNGWTALTWLVTGAGLIFVLYLAIKAGEIGFGGGSKSGGGTSVTAPRPRNSADVLLEHLESSESRFDSLSARIGRVGGAPIFIDRARFAMWKEMLQKEHSRSLEEEIEKEVITFDKRLDANEVGLQSLQSSQWRVR